MGEGGGVQGRRHVLDVARNVRFNAVSALVTRLPLSVFWPASLTFSGEISAVVDTTHLIGHSLLHTYPAVFSPLHIERVTRWRTPSCIGAAQRCMLDCSPAWHIFRLCAHPRRRVQSGDESSDDHVLAARVINRYRGLFQVNVRALSHQRIPEKTQHSGAAGVVLMVLRSLPRKGDGVIVTCCGVFGLSPNIFLVLHPAVVAIARDAGIGQATLGCSK